MNYKKMRAQSKCPAKSRITWSARTASSVYASGDVYKGDFMDDEFNGGGTVKYANDDKYVGDWENGRIHYRFGSLRVVVGICSGAHTHTMAM